MRTPPTPDSWYLVKLLLVIVQALTPHSPMGHESPGDFATWRVRLDSIYCRLLLYHSSLKAIYLAFLKQWWGQVSLWYCPQVQSPLLFCLWPNVVDKGGIHFLRKKRPPLPARRVQLPRGADLLRDVLVSTRQLPVWPLPEPQGSGFAICLHTPCSAWHTGPPSPPSFCLL